MTNNSEYLRGGKYLADLTQTLYATSALKDIDFSNVTLSGPGVTAAFDREASLDNISFSAVWPAGSPSGNSFESVITPEGAASGSPADEVLLNRNVILEGAVDTASFDRVPQELKDYWAQHRERIAPMPPIRFAEARAALADVPLAIAVGSRVIKSAVSQPGERMLHLWYPADVNPKAALIRMRQGVRQAIAEELL